MRTVAPALPAAARRAATGVPSRNWTMYSSAPCAYTGPAAADINVMTNVVAPQRNADFEVFIPAPMNATPPPGRLDRRAQARMCPNPAVSIQTSSPEWVPGVPAPRAVFTNAGIVCQFEDRVANFGVF